MRNLKTWQWTLVILILFSPFVLAQTRDPTYTITHIRSDKPADTYGEGGNTVVIISGRPTAETIADGLRSNGTVSVVVSTGNNDSHMMTVVGFNTTGDVVSRVNGTDDLSWHDCWLYDPATNKTWRFTLQDNHNESSIVYYWGTWRDILEQVTVTKSSDQSPGTPREASIRETARNQESRSRISDVDSFFLK